MTEELRELAETLSVALAELAAAAKEEAEAAQPFLPDSSVATATTRALSLASAAEAAKRLAEALR